MNQVIHRQRVEQRRLWIYWQTSSAKRHCAPHHVDVIVKSRVH